MKKLLFAAALLLSPIAADAQPTAFSGPTTPYIYTGCIDVRACFRLTVTVGPIDPFGAPNTFMYTTRGATLALTSTYYERGFSHQPLWGATSWWAQGMWQDAGYASTCHELEFACLGTSGDSGFTSGYVMPIYQNLVLPETWAITAQFVNDGVGAERMVIGSGTAVLSPVPEPSTYALMAAGLAALEFVSRRRRS